jgi:nucleotide-binding universal stress UspA family protein
MFKSMLVALKPSANQRYVIDYAVAIAERLGAELAATTAIDVNQIAPPEPLPIGGGIYKQQWDQKLIADAESKAKELVKACEFSAASGGVSCRAEVVEGGVVSTLQRKVQEHDLLVVGHSSGDPTGDETLLFQILKRSPRPAIVGPKRRVTGQSVLVAYDGSVQAARTMASFVHSGLGEGRSVHVVACHSQRDEASALCEIAGRFLGRHGLQSELHLSDGSAAESILSLAERTSAELLVMGAFGRASVAEFFFGSTTRTILGELPLPVFLDH